MSLHACRQSIACEILAHKHTGATPGTGTHTGRVCLLHSHPAATYMHCRRSRAAACCCILPCPEGVHATCLPAHAHAHAAELPVMRLPMHACVHVCPARHTPPQMCCYTTCVAHGRHPNGFNFIPTTPHIRLSARMQPGSVESHTQPPLGCGFILLPASLGWLLSIIATSRRLNTHHRAAVPRPFTPLLLWPLPLLPLLR